MNRKIKYCIKIFTLLKLTYRLGTILIKIPAGFWQAYSKIYMKEYRAKNQKKILSYIHNSYKAIVFMTDLGLNK